MIKNIFFKCIFCKIANCFDFLTPITLKYWHGCCPWSAQIISFSTRHFAKLQTFPQFFDRFFPADQQICISPCMRRICSVLVRYATAFLVRNTILRTPITLENLRFLFTFVERSLEHAWKYVSVAKNTWTACIAAYIDSVGDEVIVSHSAYF